MNGFMCLNCCIILIDVLFKNICKLKCPVNSRCLSPQSICYKAYFFNKSFLMFSFMVPLKKISKQIKTNKQIIANQEQKHAVILCSYSCCTIVKKRILCQFLNNEKAFGSACNETLFHQLNQIFNGGDSKTGGVVYQLMRQVNNYNFMIPYI